MYKSWGTYVVTQWEEKVTNVNFWNLIAKIMSFGNFKRRKQRLVISSVVKTKASLTYSSWLWFDMLSISSSSKWLKYHLPFILIFLCISHSTSNDVKQRNHLVCIIRRSTRLYMIILQNKLSLNEYLVPKIIIYNWTSTIYDI